MGGARASQGFARGTPANIRRFGNTYASATVAQKRNRTMYGYTGNGMYTGQGAYRGRGAYSVGSFLKAASPFAKIAAEAGGRALLNTMPYGGAIRTGLNALGYRGMGAYSREGVSNDLVTGKGLAPVSSGVPHFRTMPGEDGSLMVSYREYIGDVFGNSGDVPFVVNSIPMNPGLETSFPWLSQIASNFKEYEWKQCVFDFRSMITDMTTTNGQLGQIIMTSEYNVDAQAYEDKNEMLTTVHAVSGKVIDDITHGVECDPSKLSGNPGKYIRTKPVLISEDKKEYDLANFQFAVCDTPEALANLPLGQLYVSYTVLLRKARTFSARGNMISRWLAASPYATAGATASALKSSHFFGLSNSSVSGTGFLQAQQNNFPVSFISLNNSTMGTVGVLNRDLKIPALVDADVGKILKHPQTNLPFSDTQNGTDLTRYKVLQTHAITNRLFFPASYSGVVRVLVQVECILLAGATSTEGYSISLPLLVGNVSSIPDMYGVNVGEGQAGGGPGGLSRNIIYGVASATSRQLYMLMHLKVKPASDGVDNGLLWTSAFSGATATTQGTFGDNPQANVGCNMLIGVGVGADPATKVNVIQASIDVQEYNSSFAQSAAIPAPVFVNRDGTVQVPG